MQHKQRRRGGRKVQLPDWVMKKIKHVHELVQAYHAKFRQPRMPPAIATRMQHIPSEAQLLQASPTDIRQVVVLVCVRLLRSSEPTRWFSKMTPDEHPRRHLADGLLSSLFAPSRSLSSFGSASVMMCCSARPASSSAPSVLQSGMRVGMIFLLFRWRG